MLSKIADESLNDMDPLVPAKIREMEMQLIYENIFLINKIMGKMENFHSFKFVFFSVKRFLTISSLNIAAYLPEKCFILIHKTFFLIIKKNYEKISSFSLINCMILSK